MKHQCTTVLYNQTGGFAQGNSLGRPGTVAYEGGSRTVSGKLSANLYTKFRPSIVQSCLPSLAKVDHGAKNVLQDFKPTHLFADNLFRLFSSEVVCFTLQATLGSNAPNVPAFEVPPQKLAELLRV